MRCDAMCSAANALFQNGLRNHALEPARIRDVHEFETSFIQEWLAQWEDRKRE